MNLTRHLSEAVQLCDEAVQERTSRSWQPSPGTWRHETTYVFADGKRLTREGKYADDIIFPASAGASLLVFCRPSEGAPETYDIASQTKRYPVIGWRLDSDGVPTPVTMDGHHSCSWDRDFVAVEFRDGAVRWVQPRMTDDTETLQVSSLEQWINCIRSIWKDQLAAEAKASAPCAHCGGTRPFTRGAVDDEIPF